MRLFVAIDLDGKVIENIVSVQKRLASHDFDLKFVEPENLHLTLKFLGEVQESQREQIEKLISAGMKDVHAFSISFHGIGYFRSKDRINVIWAGVKEGSQDFVKLAKALDAKLSFIRRNEHEPSPHLSIARVRSGRNVRELAHEVDSLRDVKMGEVSVKDIRLKQSMLTPQGPIYSDVKVFPLLERKASADAFRQESGE